MSGAKLVGRGAQRSIRKVRREMNWSAGVPGDGGVVVRRQEVGRSLELRGGGAPAGYVDEPPPPRPAAVLLRHLIPWQSLLQGGRGCLLISLVRLGVAGCAWSWRRGTGRLAGRRRHPTSSCVWKEKRTRGEDKGRLGLLWDRLHKENCKKPSHLGLGFQKTITFQKSFKKLPIHPLTVAKNTNHTLKPVWRSFWHKWSTYRLTWQPLTVQIYSGGLKISRLFCNFNRDAPPVRFKFGQHTPSPPSPAARGRLSPELTRAGPRPALAGAARDTLAGNHMRRPEAELACTALVEARPGRPERSSPAPPRRRARPLRPAVVQARACPRSPAPPEVVHVRAAPDLTCAAGISPAPLWAHAWSRGARPGRRLSRPAPGGARR
jgi:hypothetical protein